MRSFYVTLFFGLPFLIFSVHPVLADRVFRYVGDDDYTWERFKADYDKVKPKDGTALLKMLIEKAKCSFTLVYDSRSRHNADYQTPRIIAGCNDGRLLVAFGTDPKDPLYEEVEAIETHEKPKEFRPHSLNFADKKAAKVDHPDSIKQCRECHTDLHRPNWDSYPVWPGAYGSMSEGHVEKEEAEFNKVMAKDNPNERVKLVQPFLNNIRMSNTGLTQAINARVGEVITTKFKKELFPYRYALLYARHRECWKLFPITDVLPPAVVAKHDALMTDVMKERGKKVEPGKLMEAVIRDTSDAGNGYLKRKNEKLMKRFKLTAEEYKGMNHEPRSFPYEEESGRSHEGYANLRYLLEGAGVKASEIYPHFEKNTFTEGLGGLGLYYDEKDDPDYKKLPYPYTYDNDEEKKAQIAKAYCEKVKEMSLAAFAALEAKPHVAPKVEPKTTPAPKQDGKATHEKR